MRIVTTKQLPVYVPDSAWSAVDDETYDGEGSPIGWGATREEAIADLLDQIEPDDPAPPAT